MQSGLLALGRCFGGGEGRSDDRCYGRKTPDSQEPIIKPPIQLVMVLQSAVSTIFFLHASYFHSLACACARSSVAQLVSRMHLEFTLSAFGKVRRGVHLLWLVAGSFGPGSMHAMRCSPKQRDRITVLFRIMSLCARNELGIHSKVGIRHDVLRTIRVVLFVYHRTWSRR
jgi:hypothetical protein